MLRRVGLSDVPWEHDLEAARGAMRVLPVTRHESAFSGSPLSWLFLVSQSPGGDLVLVAALKEPEHASGVWTSSEPNRMSVRRLNSYQKWLPADRVPGATNIASDDAAFLLDTYATVSTQDEAVALASPGNFAPLTGEAIAAAQRREARSSASYRGREADLRRLFELWDKPTYECVLAFEAQFGGLRVPDVEVPDDLMWFGEPYECWFLGSYWLLADDCAGLASSNRHPGLVPIGMGPDEGLAYLDEAGRVFVEDMLDGEIRQAAACGLDFVEEILTTVRQ
jgi:hypothetical protein